MSILFDGLSGFFRLTTVSFVKKKREHGDTYTFYFRARRLQHIAGQHGMFAIPRLGVFGIRLFSLSSAPEEEFVTISTHVGSNSHYKRYLMNMKKGQKIVLLGPVLFFFLRPHVTHYVFLAQGIGITPFRSLLKHIDEQKSDVRTTLVHVGKDHTFRDLTEKVATESHYVAAPEAFTATVLALPRRDDQRYYISGSPKFVSTTKKTLRSHGIKRSQITSDNFFGY